MKLNLKFILFFFFLGIIQSGYAQKEKIKFSFPQNDYILIPKFNDENIRVEINVKNLFDGLIFVKEDSIYESEFIIHYKFASINNPDRIYQRNISENIKTTLFKDTNSRSKYAILKDEIDLKPDKYIFSLKGYSANGNKELFNFSDSLKWDTQKELTASDFIILKRDSSIFIGMEKFGVPIGIAFQLRDDELGMFSEQRPLHYPHLSDRYQDHHHFFHTDSTYQDIEFQKFSKTKRLQEIVLI